MANRLYKYDNLKAILIFLVVLGHFIEIVEGHRLLYLVIYSFHMPLFIFISGYFARFNRKNILCRLIWPYCVFQVLYTYFEIVILGSGNLTLTFVRPRWLLWYIFAMIVYYLLIPFFDVRQYKKMCICIAVMTLVSLLVGYDAQLGYDFSAQRIFTFMPFFFAGYYMPAAGNKAAKVNTYADKKYVVKLCSALALIVLIVKILDLGIITKEMLYGSYSYAAAGYNMPLKLMILLMAVLWIAIAVTLMPDVKVPLLSSIGRYTMPVFLIHGFIVKLVGKYYVENRGKLPFLYAVFLSGIVVCLLGNKWVNSIFNKVFTDKWVKKLMKSFKTVKGGRICLRKN